MAQWGPAVSKERLLADRVAIINGDEVVSEPVMVDVYVEEAPDHWTIRMDRNVTLEWSGPGSATGVGYFLGDQLVHWLAVEVSPGDTAVFHGGRLDRD